MTEQPEASTAPPSDTLSRAFSDPAEHEQSPIPEPDTPAPGLPEPAEPGASSEPEAPAEDEPAAEEEPAKPDHAERLRGLFSDALISELVSINERLDAAGL